MKRFAHILVEAQKLATGNSVYYFPELDRYWIAPAHTVIDTTSKDVACLRLTTRVPSIRKSYTKSLITQGLPWDKKVLIRIKDHLNRMEEFDALQYINAGIVPSQTGVQCRTEGKHARITAVIATSRGNWIRKEMGRVPAGDTSIIKKLLKEGETYIQEERNKIRDKIRTTANASFKFINSEELKQKEDEYGSHVRYTEKTKRKLDKEPTPQEKVSARLASINNHYLAMKF